MFAKYGDVAFVLVAWYWPREATDRTRLDIVPMPGVGNTLTVREYQQKWLALYQLKEMQKCTDVAAREMAVVPRGPSYASVVVTGLQCAMEQVNTDFYTGEIAKTIVGNRPTTMDTYPILGQLSAEGIWVASGTKRDGFHMSPKLADDFVTAIETGKQPFEGTFVPERTLILETSKKEAIDRAVAHIISTGYQHGFRAPHSNWDPMIEEGIRRRVNDAYEKAGLADHDIGIPAELLDMYRYGHAKLNVEALLASRR